MRETGDGACVITRMVAEGLLRVMVPRATFDLDILIAASLENCRRVLEALRDVGMGTSAMVTPEELLAHEITVFQDRVRLDVQTFTPGLEFPSAWAHKIRMEYQGQVFFVVSREDLITSKRASGRSIDLEDVRALEEADGSS